MTDTRTLVEARATDLATIKSMLEEQRVRRHDVVVSSTAMSAYDGMLRVRDGEVDITEDGVTAIAGEYAVGSVWCEGIARRVDLPGMYLDRWHENRVDIFDQVVNRALHGGERNEGTSYPADGRTHLLRLLRGDPGEPGFARAFLSPKYRFIESYDAVIAMLDGARQAGVDVRPGICDMTERRCTVTLEAPGIAALAPKLLAGYRSQFDGQDAHVRAGDAMRLIQQGGGGWTIPEALAAAAREGQGYPEGQEPVVWAGIRFTNSETGHGKRTIAPMIRVRVCRNGLVINAVADAKVHIGGAQGEGVVEWSADAVEKELALITAQSRDAVATYLSQEFLDEQVRLIEEMAGAPIRRPEETVRELVRKAGFTKAQADDVFGFFVEGGQPSAGGLANAVTALSQTIPDADLAARYDEKAYGLMQAAAALAR